MFWETLDYDNVITSLGASSSFFLLRLPGKYLLFIHEGEMTAVLVLHLEGNRLVVDCVKNIPSKHSVSTITGNSNCVVMHDVKEEFYYLQGTVGNNSDCFKENNADTFLTVDAVLSWQRLHQFTNCLSMTGITNGLFLLYHHESVYAAHYSTLEIKNGLFELSNNILNVFFDGEVRYFVAPLRGEMAKRVGERIFKSSQNPVKEVLLVIKPSQIYFILPNQHDMVLSQAYPVHLNTDTVINVLAFEKKNWIVIICKSGKIVSLMFGNCSKSFQFGYAHLPKPASAIVGYELDMIYLVWSDLHNLYMSKLNDDNVIINMKVSKNIRGVRHFVKIDDNIIAITVHGYLYETRTSLILDQETQLSSHSLLKNLLQAGEEMEKLTEQVSSMEKLMKLTRTTNISKVINVTGKEGMIVIENKTDYLFKKGLWRVLIEGKDFEMKELENDIVPGGRITFKSSVTMASSITLVSDEVTFEVEVEYDRNKTENDELNGIRQFLNEYCTFRF